MILLWTHRAPLKRSWGLPGIYRVKKLWSIKWCWYVIPVLLSLQKLQCSAHKFPLYSNSFHHPGKPCQLHKWVIQHLPLSHSFSLPPGTFFLTPLSSMVNPGPSHSLKQLLLQVTIPWVICEWLFGGSSPYVLYAQGFPVHFHLNFFGTFTLMTPKLSINNIPSYFHFPL